MACFSYFSHSLISFHVSSFTLNWNKCVGNKLAVTYCQLSTQTTLLIYFKSLCTSVGGTWWRSWLRHCATSRKVASSIPNGVIEIFHWHNPSGLTMALGLTQPLTEMNTRNISWGVKAAGAYGWQPHNFQVLTVLKSGSLNLLEPSGPVQACNGIALTLPYVLL